MEHGGGITFAFRLHEESGAPASEIARVYAAARDIFGMRAQWGEIEALDTKVTAEVQVRLLLEGRRLVERGARWLLAHRSRPLDIGATVHFFSPGAVVLQKALPRLLGPSDVEPLMVQADEFEQAGVPPGLAQRVAGLSTMFSTFDIVEVAAETELDVEEVAAVHFRLGERLELHWLRDRIVALPRDDRWRALARAALRDDLYSLHRALTAEVLRDSERRRIGQRARGRLGRAQSRVRALHADAGRDPRRPRVRHDHAAGRGARGAQPADGRQTALGRPRLGGVPLGGPGARLGRLDLAVLGRRVRDQLGEQARRRPRPPRRSRARTPRRWPATACVKPLILRTYCSRGGTHLGVGRGRLEVVEGADVAAHALEATDHSAPR